MYVLMHDWQFNAGADQLGAGYRQVAWKASLHPPPYRRGDQGSGGHKVAGAARSSA